MKPVGLPKVGTSPRQRTSLADLAPREADIAQRRHPVREVDPAQVYEPADNRDRNLRGALPLGENDRVRQEAFSPGPLPSRGQFSRRLLDRIANFLCSNFQCPRQRGHQVACLREIAGAEAGETTKPFADVGVAAPFHEHDGGEIEDGESTRNQSVYWQDFFSRDVGHEKDLRLLQPRRSLSSLIFVTRGDRISPKRNHRCQGRPVGASPKLAPDANALIEDNPGYYKRIRL